MKKIFLTLLLTTGMVVSAQVKIGDNETNLNSDSLLELEATDKGVLFPRVALTSTTAASPLAAHVQGMTVYNTATAGDVTPGMYTNNGAVWVKLVPSYQNIGGNVQSGDGSFTILETTYFVLYGGATTGTLTMPTLLAGKTIWVKNNGTNAATVAGISINGGRMRAFVCDGTTWYPSNQ